MNILFVNSTVKWGGVKTWMLEYGTKLASRGHKVILCANKKETGSFIGRCRENGLTVYPMKFGVDYSPLTIWRFISLIRKEKIDVVCTNIEKDNRSAGIAAKLSGKKVIQRVGLISDLRDGFKFRFIQAVVVDNIIVPCNYIKEGLKKLPWLKQGKIFVVHNGKDLRKYQPNKNYNKVRRELGVPENTVLLCVSSQLTKTKGHQYLLEAFSLLKKKYENIKLLIVGQGPLREELEDKTKALGLDDSVIFLGHRNDINRVVDAADIAVLPSLEEGFPNTIVEYMALGRPVVATNIAGIPEIVVDQETGFLVPTADSGKLAEALERLILDKKERYRMGRSGRERIERLFNIEDKVLELENVLKV